MYYLIEGVALVALLLLPMLHACLMMNLKDKKNRLMAGIGVLCCLGILVGSEFWRNSLPYEVEHRELYEGANKVCCSLYEKDGQYFIIGNYRVSNEDFAENGPRYVKLNIDRSVIDDEFLEPCDCNDEVEHYDKLRMSEAAGGANHICCNLYKDGDEYCVMQKVSSDDVLLGYNYVRVDITKDEAVQLMEVAADPNHDCAAHSIN